MRQDEEFWKYLKRYDHIGMCETWLKKKDWIKIKDLLPKTHKWYNINVKRIKGKGRASGGIMIGNRKTRGRGKKGM